MRSKYKFSFRITVVKFLFLGILSCNSILAQDIEFLARAERVMRTGEQFQLVYSVNQNIDNFRPPDFGEFQYLGGPMQSSSTSVNIINGKTTRTSTNTFTYYLQAPSEPGKYKIEPAAATFKRNPVQSNQLEIEVVGPSQGTSPTTTQNSDQEKYALQAAGSEDLYVRLEIDKSSVYQGELINARIKLYTKVPVVSIEDLKIPDFVGFYKQDVDRPPLKSLQREKVGNEIYNTGVIMMTILFPQKSGSITIGPLEMNVVVQEQTRRQSRGLLDDFFGPQYNHKRITLKSKPVTIEVKPLPVNRPAEFSGAVGQFAIKASASSNEITTNDAITFKVIISGKGNIKLLEKINTQFPPAFDVFDPVKKVTLDNNTNGQSGSVSYEYTAIPRHAGTFQVPPFILNYFDPATGSFKSISSSEFDITVAKGEGDSTTVAMSNLSKEDIQLLGSDIRYIHPVTSLRPRGFYILGNPYFYLVYLVAFLSFIIVLLIRREQIKRSANAVKYRNRKAGKIAGKRLKSARKVLKSNNKEAFYEELGRALWNYVSDKLSIPVSQLSRERVAAEFDSRALETGMKDNFFTVIDTCEYARFAPGTGDSGMKDMYDKAVRLINKLDQKL
jgi:hypothetical protein